MAWAKLANGTLLQRTPIVLPVDHWVQVDVWVPAQNLTACDDGDLFGDSAYLLLAADGIFLNDWTYPNGGWALETDYGANAGPMTTNATHTLKYHRKSDNTADWYLDGTLIATDHNVSSFSQLYLGWGAEGCACETYYFTNVKVGTSDGGTDIFSDDFSGGLGNWTIKTFNNGGAAAAVVSSPSDSCPLITLSPAQGPVGTTVHVSGTGFAPSSPLTLYFQNIPTAFSAATSDASGNVVGTFVVPRAPAGTPDFQDVYRVSLRDTAANIAIANFVLCSNTPADGIFTEGNDPLAIVGPVNSPVTDQQVLAYIRHNGAHWIVYQDESQFSPAVRNSNGDLIPPSPTVTFPPPTNHNLNLVRIEDDGTTTTYELDTDYCWNFGSGNVGALLGTRWVKTFYFASWSKPVYDVKLASDGTTLWIAVKTAATVQYPYISIDDTYDGNPSQISQFVDIVTLTGNYTHFGTNTSSGYTRYYHDTTGFAGLFGEYHYPTSDGGDHGSGYWTIPRIVMFAGTEAGFNRIGELDAQYCPGSTDGSSNSQIMHPFSSLYNVDQTAPRSSWNSPLSIAASDAEPGVCHLVWSEGGDWGRWGEGLEAVPDQWDAGPPNRSYRVVYTTWDAGSKTGEHNLWDVTIDRSNWYFDFAFQDGQGNWSLWKVGYTWPEQEQMLATSQHQLRNEHGSPVLFIAWPRITQGSGVDNADRPWLDNNQSYTLPWVEMYDISSGAPVLLQKTTPDLLPTEAEMEFFYPLNPSRGVVPPLTPDTIAANTAGRSFGVSLLYEDPLLGGQPVYLLAVPFFQSVNPGTGGLEAYQTRCFFRVPVDGSAPFDYLDGTRQVNFTVNAEGYHTPQWGNFDFYSDAKNIWCPNGLAFTSDFFAQSGIGLQYDRICTNQWAGYQLTPGDNFTQPPGNFGLAGFYHDPVADTISYPSNVAPTWDPVLQQWDGPGWAIATLEVCRGCRSCQCKPSGIHAFLRYGHNH